MTSPRDETQRTDAEGILHGILITDPNKIEERLVRASFARQLERELTTALREKAEAEERLATTLAAMDEDDKCPITETAQQFRNKFYEYKKRAEQAGLALRTLVERAAKVCKEIAIRLNRDANSSDPRSTARYELFRAVRAAEECATAIRALTPDLAQTESAATRPHPGDGTDCRKGYQCTFPECSCPASAADLPEVATRPADILRYEGAGTLTDKPATVTGPEPTQEREDAEIGRLCRKGLHYTGEGSPSFDRAIAEAICKIIDAARGGKHG